MGDTGTVLIGTGTGRTGAGGPGGGGGNQGTLVLIGGASGATTKDDTKQTVTDDYVPVGARRFKVASAQGFRPGDTVIVRRAGDVIPEVVSVVPDKRMQEAQLFTMPRHCPVCGSEAVREEGEVTIIPVHEEVVVVATRLKLVEEVHIRRHRITSTARERVTLRREEASVDRYDVSAPGEGDQD